MAIIIHYPHGKDKKGYAYDHHRVGRKVVCTYLGRAEVKTSDVMDNGFREREGYEDRHGFANKKEKEEYGEKRFDELNDVIEKKLEPNELAGKYKGDTITVNSKIPDISPNPKEDERTLREQVRDHELYEREYHREQYPELEGAKKPEERVHEAIHNPKKVREEYGLEGYKHNPEKRTQQEIIKDAMKHPDTLGAGASKRRGITNPDTKFKIVMKEYDRGTLRSSSGERVTDRKQAEAIAYSEARKVDPEYGKDK